MEEQTLPAEHAALPIGDIIKYIQLISQIIMLAKQAVGLKVGSALAVWPVKFTVGEKRYQFDKDGLTRTA